MTELISRLWTYFTAPTSPRRKDCLRITERTGIDKDLQVCARTAWMAGYEYFSLRDRRVYHVQDQGSPLRFSVEKTPHQYKDLA